MALEGPELECQAQTGHFLLKIIIITNRGSWVAQLVKHPTLGFGSGHELTVREF